MHDDGIVISKELSKTHIWQDLVNSDRQLAVEREKKHKKQNNRSLKKRTNPPPIDEDVNLPLIVHTNANINNTNNTNKSHIIPTIIVGNANSNNSNTRIKEENSSKF